MSLQTFKGKTVYIVDFDVMPKLPIHGLTHAEKVWQDLVYAASYPHGPSQILGFGRADRITYAQALNHAIETGVITEPGKYAIYLVPGTQNYEIYSVIEPSEGCSIDCLLQKDKPSTADDERWHHRDCPNHSTACCGINEELPEQEGDSSPKKEHTS